MESVKIMNLVLVVSLVMAGCMMSKGNAVEPKTQITCPVMREHIMPCGIDKEVYADYRGKRIYFCSEGCHEKFKKDPEKYIKILEDEGVTLKEVPGSDDKKGSNH